MTTPPNADDRHRPDHAVGVDERRVAGRAELRPTERRAGSADPRDQARTILEDAERRRVDAVENPLSSGERRTSDEAAAAPADRDDRSGLGVLIGVDDSDQSRHAVDVAFRFFGSEARYILINVGQHMPMFTAAYPTGTHATAAELNATFARAEVAAWKTAESAARRLEVSDEETEVEAEARVGPIATSLIEAADEHHCDVIVIGSHDKSLWRRLIDPSIGHSLVDRSDRPVLIVRGDG